MSNPACKQKSITFNIQLLMFNSVKHKRATDSSSTVRHNQDRDMPLPLYISMKIHAVTCSRNLIDTLFDLGMCCSYDQLLKLTSKISVNVCQQYSADGVVCPLKLNSGLFTTAAVDNIDYNPTSATAKESFHGTGIISYSASIPHVRGNRLT